VIVIILKVLLDSLSSAIEFLRELGLNRSAEGTLLIVAIPGISLSGDSLSRKKGDSVV